MIGYSFIDCVDFLALYYCVGAYPLVVDHTVFLFFVLTAFIPVDSPLLCRKTLKNEEKKYQVGVGGPFSILESATPSSQKISIVPKAN